MTEVLLVVSSVVPSFISLERMEQAPSSFTELMELEHHGPHVGAWP